MFPIAQFPAGEENVFSHICIIVSTYFQNFSPPRCTPLLSSSSSITLLSSLSVNMPRTSSSQPPGRCSSILIHARSATCNLSRDNSAVSPRPPTCESVTRPTASALTAASSSEHPRKHPAARSGSTTELSSVELVRTDRPVTTVSSPTTPVAAAALVASLIRTPSPEIQFVPVQLSHHSSAASSSSPYKGSRVRSAPTSVASSAPIAPRRHSTADAAPSSALLSMTPMNQVALTDIAIPRRPALSLVLPRVTSASAPYKMYASVRRSACFLLLMSRTGTGLPDGSNA